MRRWGRYLVVFLLGGLSAVGMGLVPTGSLSQKENLGISGGFATTSAVPSAAETAVVARVIDGDTIELVDGRRVRYVGMDTPELTDKDASNWLLRSCFAREAMEENRRLVDGKTVRLEKDISDTDRYGRLLRYVYIRDVFVNEALVRHGYAKVATFPPDVAHAEELLAAEREARREERGLWSGCP